MTRPNALVLDGDEVKLRLQAERTASKSAVHVDWVRFTVIRRNCPAPSLDDLFPLAGGDAAAWDRLTELDRVLRDTPDCEHGAAAQAMELAQEVASALGSEFAVGPEARKGHDFYKFRLSIERNGVECGWVGFQASSDSPRQRAQAKTLHVNLYGAACTFAERGWNERIAAIVDQRAGTLTRCDLALDFFDGFHGGMQRVYDDYKAGLMDVGGKRLRSNMVGQWANDCERSFYFGSKEAGKQTNVYEKGDQLYGADANSPWIRIELRYGNKLRELPSDMLRRPADFFACASDWHAAMLREIEWAPEPAPAAVPCRGRLPIETVKAEATRAMNWLKRTAGPVVGLALRELPEWALLQLMSNPQKPGRLARFSAAEISAAITDVLAVEGHSPAFT
jgi:phage replication initiation protein